MATLMDMIMMRRAGMDDPRAAADMQAMELQNMFRTAQQPAASGFGSLPPMQSSPGRPPMMVGLPMPPSVLSQAMPVRQMDSTLFGEDVGARPAPMRAMDSTLAGYDMPPNVPRPSAPMAPAGAPTQLASAAPSVRESFMQRLLSGPNYQSNSMPVMPQGATTPQQINWGDPDSAADFVRANQAYMGLLG